MLRKISLVATVIAFSWPMAASAGVISSQTFEPVIPTANGQTPGAWYIDRAAPAEFVSEFFKFDDRLALKLEASQAVNGFTGTQGRKFDTPGATSLSVDMYIGVDFADFSNAFDNRIGGLWGTGFDANNAISMYPIIEFFDNQFHVFDSIDTGEFIAVGGPSTFGFDEFHNLAFVLNTADDVVDFFVNGELLITMDAGGTLSFENAILQGINKDINGPDRTLYFDNFLASNEVPTPSTLALFFAGLIGMVVVRRRRIAS